MAKIVLIVQLAAHAKSSTWYGRSYGRTSNFFWLDGLLLFCIIIRAASSAIRNNGNLVTDIPLGGPSCHCFRVELEFRVLVFVKGRRPKEPEKNPRSQDQNQQQTQPSCTCNFRYRSEPGPQEREASALTTASSPLPAGRGLAICL